MLDLRPSCEHCGTALAPDALDARICTFECTFCAICADAVLGGVCPNCDGELVARPVRPSDLLGSAPPSSEEVRSTIDVAGHRTRLVGRSNAEDHPRTVLLRYAAAWQDGDLATLIDCYAADFMLHYVGASRFAGTHAGRDVALATMAEVSMVAARELVDVLDVLVSDTGGALLVHERLTRDGRSAVVERLLRYRVEGGRLAECWLLEADQALVDEMWA